MREIITKSNWKTANGDEEEEKVEGGRGEGGKWYKKEVKQRREEKSCKHWPLSTKL